MPGVFVENNDPDGVFRAAGEAIERARTGGGPTLIEIETYRPPATSWATAKPTAPRARRTA